MRVSYFCWMIPFGRRMDTFGKECKLLAMYGARYAELEFSWIRDSLVVLLKLGYKSK